MTYSILPAQPSDVSDIALISHDAFKDDPIVGQLTPNVPREADHAWQVRSLTGTIANAERDGVRFMKAIDDESGSVKHRLILQATLGLFHHKHVQSFFHIS